MNAEQTKQLEHALEQLLECDGDDCFVLIEEQTTRKFVQFAASSKAEIVLDLPVKSLTDEERHRAEQLFSSFRVMHGEHGFEVLLDRDISQAVEVTSRIFNEVYLVDSHAQFTITDADGALAEEEDECDRCGRVTTGRYKWMRYGWATMMTTGSPLEREFFCFRCLRIMRIYSVIGFSLLGLVVAAFVAMTIWLIYFTP